MDKITKRIDAVAAYENIRKQAKPVPKQKIALKDEGNKAANPSHLGQNVDVKA